MSTVLSTAIGLMGTIKRIAFTTRKSGVTWFCCLKRQVSFTSGRGNEALTYRIVDKSKNNRDPTLYDKMGQIRPYIIVYGCPYFKCIHKVYEIDFIEKNPAAAAK